MKKIAVVTTTRADYGLLSPIIKALRKYESSKIRIELIVTGTHLSKYFGMTVNEINDRIDCLIETFVTNSSEIDISTNQADTLIKFTQLFVKKNYNAIVLLGDRYETLAVAIAAGNCNIPLFHLCGGDTTQGAIDEWIRHSITKMSYLHFVTNEDSRNRVIQMGEDPERVFNYGSTSIDNILSLGKISKIEALHSIGLEDCKYALCTYHPVTMDNSDVDNKIEAFLKSLEFFSDIEFVITKSNADQGGSRINELLDNADKKISNIHVFFSLGNRRYLSLMKYAEFVIGNSSSGIVEAPYFQIPTVNIGERQKGRLQSNSIINCNDDTLSIIKAINIAISNVHKVACRSFSSPYGDGHAANQIADKMIETVMMSTINLKKGFYNIPIV